MTARKQPSAKPMASSRRAMRTPTSRDGASTASMRMINVADCDPALPPDANTSGRNRIIQVYASETVSYCLSIAAVATAAPERTASQTPRLRRIVSIDVSR